MNYWKKLKTNEPNLYLYKWIRVNYWFFLTINSIIMCFISTPQSLLDEIVARKNLLYIFTAIVGVWGISLCSDYCRRPNNLWIVIVETVEIGIFSLMFLCDNFNIIFLYFLELLVIIYSSIKIHKDNSIIDKCKLIIWYERRKRSRYNKSIERGVRRELRKKSKRSEVTKVELTEEQKLKKMSRKQRKEYKEKR